MKLYIDTSAAAKLLRAEAESGALAEFCDRPDVQLVSTDLLETELRRLAVRQELPQAAVTAVIAGIDLHEIPRSSYTEAGMLDGPTLRSLDALHLMGALRLSVDGMLVYDERMAEATTNHGLAVHAPAASLHPS